MIATFVLSEENVKSIVREYVSDKHHFSLSEFRIEVTVDEEEKLTRVAVSRRSE